MSIDKYKCLQCEKEYDYDTYRYVSEIKVICPHCGEDEGFQEFIGEVHGGKVNVNS